MFNNKHFYILFSILFSICIFSYKGYAQEELSHGLKELLGEPQEVSIYEYEKHSSSRNGLENYSLIHPIKATIILDFAKEEERKEFVQYIFDLKHRQISILLWPFFASADSSSNKETKELTIIGFKELTYKYESYLKHFNEKLVFFNPLNSFNSNHEFHPLTFIVDTFEQFTEPLKYIDRTVKMKVLYDWNEGDIATSKLLKGTDGNEFAFYTEALKGIALFEIWSARVTNKYYKLLKHVKDISIDRIIDQMGTRFLRSKSNDFKDLSKDIKKHFINRHIKIFEKYFPKFEEADKKLCMLFNEKKAFLGFSNI